MTIRRLDARETTDRLDDLAAILLDAVSSGASVGFMAGSSAAEACGFFESLIPSIATGERIVFGAFNGDRLIGTVQLVCSPMPNQHHRADVAKMLVHRSARRQGIGEALMQALEAHAASIGRTVLVLDSVTGGDAARLYERLGWVRVGDVPDYALMPDGSFCSTTFFYRKL